MIELLNPDEVFVLDRCYPKSSYVSIDLSVDNDELAAVNVSSEEALQKYIDEVISRSNGKVGYGGYLEQRGIYNRSEHFNESERNIHLGVDIWAPEGTAVLAAFKGTIHSFANNDNYGDYGPTIILEHEFKGSVFYTLYGHLSLDSIQGITENTVVQAGEVIAKLGNSEVNGKYPPHLHFQVIKNLENYSGDYPGVCNAAELAMYKENCPDPMIWQE